MRRALTAATATAVSAVLLVALLPSAAHAKPSGGGKPSAGTSSVTVVNTDSGDPVLNWGDTVTFDVQTTATDRPAVQLDCYQGGTLVSTGSAGFYPEWPWSTDFHLRSGLWTSGAADCTARLYRTSSNGLRTYTLATQNFRVEA